MKFKQNQEMSIEWNNFELGKICNIITGKLNSNAAEGFGIYPFFTCSKEDYRISSYSFDCEAILLAGNNADGDFGIKHYKGKFDAYQRTYVITIKNENEFDYNFLFYLLKTKLDDFRRYSFGTATQYLTKTILDPFEINAPKISIQQKIGKTLSDLDIKIQNLQNQNRILEQTAQAIFKSWFVDFDEVTEFEDSELGQIPKGWQVGTFSDVINEIESGRRPKGGINSSDTEVPSIGAENIIGLGQYNYSKTKYISLEFFNEMKTGKIKDNDVLLYKDGASLGRKSLFRNGFPFKQCCINEHVFILRPNKKILPSFLFFWLDQDFMEENVQNLNSNTAQPGINKPSVLSLPILIPEINYINNFQVLVEPILTKFFKNRILIESLTKTRDALLPKLMSGEIRV